MKESAILELFELDFSDLLQLSSAKYSYKSLSSAEFQRLQLISDRVIENLGPTGPGLIAIKSVPEASVLRRRFLPLARKLALLHNDDRNRILKEHNLGSDVSLKNLDRIVSSFVMQLKYENLGCEGIERHETISNDDTNGDDFLDPGFENLGSDFKKLGFLMMKIGLCLAQICDRVIDSQELEESLLESCSAKGRLIHYHSRTDNLIIKEAAKRKGRRNDNFSTNGMDKVKSFRCYDQAKVKKDNGKSHTDFWQQWHYDYGIFTVLTSPVFLQSEEECHYPDGNTRLQIFHPERNAVFSVTASPESFIVQVGESADVLSKGMLQATLHCVSRPLDIVNLSREMFVVFLQPAWNKKLSLSEYNRQPSTSGYQQLNPTPVGNSDKQTEFEDLLGDIHSVVPPLTLRLKDGMTFAEFSRETTKRYYGGSGMQSKP